MLQLYTVVGPRWKKKIQSVRYFGQILTHFLVTTIFRLFRVASIALRGTNFNSATRQQHYAHTQPNLPQLPVYVSGLQQLCSLPLFLVQADRQLFRPSGYTRVTDWLHALCRQQGLLYLSLLRLCLASSFRGSASHWYHVIIRAKTNPDSNISIWFPN